MTREMHDSCNGGLVVRTPGVLIAGYTDGKCAVDWINQHADVWISSVQTDSATIGDCEPGNGTVAGWIDWVQRRRSRGVDPSLYVPDDSLGEFFHGYRWSEVRTAFGNAGVVDPHWWLCKPGATQIPDGVMGVQAALDISPGYDYSIIVDYWPGVDPKPTPHYMENDPMLDTLIVSNPDHHTRTFVLFPDLNPPVGAGTVMFYDTDGTGKYVWTHSVPGRWVKLLNASWQADGTTTLTGIGTDSLVWSTIWQAGQPDFGPTVRVF